MVDAVVVGAGVGGLASAIALGARGMEVLVLEAGAMVGGKAAITVVDGVEVDTGPSVLTMPDVFRTLFAAAGTRLEDELVLLEPSPGFRYLYPDGVVLDVHHHLEDTLASVSQSLGPLAADELAAFLAYAERIWDAAAPAFVYGDAPTWKTLLGGGLGQLAKFSRIDPLSTLWGAIERRVRSPHLRMLLARYATYNGSDARRAPATLSCIAHVELALGGYGVLGGMYELVRALERVAARMGVQIRCSSPVARIVVTDGAVRGVALADGSVVATRHVVANADVAAVTGALLEPHVRHGIRDDQTPSMSGYNAVVKARRAERVAHTVLFPDDYLEEFADIFDRDRPPASPTVYVCAQEACHRRPSWLEHEPLFLMCNAPAEPARSPRDDAVWRELDVVMMQRLEAAGLLDASDRVLWRRTPRELAERFPGSRGSIYGSASNNTTAAFQRPKNRVDGVRGLFLASGSAHPGGGVPLAALSGMAAARAVAHDAAQQARLRRTG